MKASIKNSSSKNKIAPHPIDFIKGSVKLNAITDVLIKIMVIIVNKVGSVEVNIKVFPGQRFLFFEIRCPIK